MLCPFESSHRGPAAPRRDYWHADCPGLTFRARSCPFRSGSPRPPGHRRNRNNSRPIVDFARPRWSPPGRRSLPAATRSDIPFRIRPARHRSRSGHSSNTTSPPCTISEHSAPVLSDTSGRCFAQANRTSRPYRPGPGGSRLTDQGNSAAIISWIKCRPFTHGADIRPAGSVLRSAHQPAGHQAMTITSPAGGVSHRLAEIEETPGSARPWTAATS